MASSDRPLISRNWKTVRAVGVAAEDAAHGIGVATEILRGTVHDEIGAPLERALVDRGGKRVVDDRRRADSARASSEPRDVEYVQRRVCRRLEVE
ncbi:MAG TPA: hypothetical protein VK912_02285 [Longimicrobiales bacterium]|nr:hypothetical protein [Longimicrobiales bacterium]